jgi:hypothetical protein
MRGNQLQRSASKWNKRKKDRKKERKKIMENERMKE